MFIVLKHCDKDFTYLISVNPYGNPKRYNSQFTDVKIESQRA